MANILLIEPDKVLAKLYLRALTHAGYNVKVARGAQEAITSADKLKIIDLVIMELQLIEHNGVEFLYEFQSYPEWYNTPIIVQSLIPGAEFKDNPILQQRLNVQSILYKPQTTLRELLKEVAKILSRHQKLNNITQ